MSATREAPPTPDADPLLPLWRAAQVFRVASLAYATVVIVISVRDWERPAVAWAALGIQVLWTGLAVTWLSTTTRHRRSLVILDVALTCALILGSWLVEPKQEWTGHDVLPTILWSCNAIVSAALFGGRRLGLFVALLVALASNLVTGDLLTAYWRNATVPVLVCVGLAVGALARTVVRTNEQLRAAIELRAATEERERLARQVHDGALQVLALVARSGGTIDPDLAADAATQERALRRLLTPAGRAGGDRVDLTVALAEFGGESVQVSGPAHPVTIDPQPGGELLAAVREALANATEHAPGATAYVLLEDLPSEIVVTVRDEGPGIPAGRLVAAERSGRLGVAQSIRGRMAAVGGSATLTTAPGEGTEWEFHLPKESSMKGGGMP